MQYDDDTLIYYFYQIIEDIEIMLNEDLRLYGLMIHLITSIWKQPRLKFASDISIIENETPLSVLLGTTMLFPNTLTAH